MLKIHVVHYGLLTISSLITVVGFQWKPLIHVMQTIPVLKVSVQSTRIRARSGLKITAGQRTMSGQNDDLSGQNFGSAVILTGHVHGFQLNNTKKFIRSISVKS